MQNWKTTEMFFSKKKNMESILMSELTIKKLFNRLFLSFIGVNGKTTDLALVKLNRPYIFGHYSNEAFLKNI